MRLIFLTTLIFSTNAFANTFFGPIQSCSLENTDYTPSKIELKVYTASPFGLSSEIQLSYSYPELDPNFTLISLLKEENEAYSGEISNISHLVDTHLKLNGNDSSLTITDDSKKYVFVGSCKDF